jgi:hypothetical protein
MTLRHTRKAPVRFTANCVFHSSSVISHPNLTEGSWGAAALFTTMSMRPKVSQRLVDHGAHRGLLANVELEADRFAAEPLDLLDHGIEPRQSSLSARATRLRRPMSVTTIFAPASAKASAMPRPIPRLLAAPVTSATMPFSTPMLLVFLLRRVFFASKVYKRGAGACQ